MDPVAYCLRNAKVLQQADGAGEEGGEEETGSALLRKRLSPDRFEAFPRNT